MDKHVEHKHGAATDRVISELRRRIAAGQYPTDRFLPPERDLAAELQTSRRTISYALEMLAAKGIVEQCRGRGSRVLPHFGRGERERVAVLHAIQQPSDALEILRVIEGIQSRLIPLGVRHDVVRLASDGAGARVAAEGPLQGAPVTRLPEVYSALLFASTCAPVEDILALEKGGALLVVANQEEDYDVTATAVDHRGVARSAVRMLASLGHRRIALVTRPARFYFYGKARAGFLDGLAEAGIAAEERLVAEAEYTNPLAAYLAVKKLLDAPDPPTAVVAARDVLAHGAWEAFSEAGRVVGRDVSIVGFDDLTWPEGREFLTTFREPCHAMGALAAEMLLERMMSGRRPPEKRIVEAPLVLRRSAAPVTMAAGAVEMVLRVDRETGTGEAERCRPQ